MQTEVEDRVPLFGFELWGEHAGGGSRRFVPDLVALGHEDGQVPGGEGAGDRKADQPATDDDGVVHDG